MTRAVMLGMLLIGGRTAWAGPWDGALSPEVVQAEVDAQATSFLVVGAGAHAETAAATEALIAGLRAKAGVQLVMDASALGDVSALDDASIAQRAQGLPVEQLLVVRVFPAGGGASSAVVSAYDPATGRRVGSFNVSSAGAAPSPTPPAASAPAPGPSDLQSAGPQAPRPSESTAPDGERLIGAELFDDRPAADAPTAGLRQAPPPHDPGPPVAAPAEVNLEAALLRYSNEYFWFDDVIVVQGDGNGGVVSGEASIAKRGSMGLTHSVPDFYRAIGEPLKAKQIEDRLVAAEVGKWTGVFAGAAGLTAGTVMIATLSSDCSQYTYIQDDCEANQRAAVRLGAPLAIGGTALGIWGLKRYFDKRWTLKDVSAAKHAAQRYNKALAEELGIPPEVIRQEGYSELPRLTLEPVAWAGPGTAGVGLSGTF